MSDNRPSNEVVSLLRKFADKAERGVSYGFTQTIWRDALALIKSHERALMRIARASSDKVSQDIAKDALWTVSATEPPSKIQSQGSQPGETEPRSNTLGEAVPTAGTSAASSEPRTPEPPSESPWKTIFGHNADGSEQDVTVCKACGRPEDDLPGGWISVNDRLPKDGDKVIYAFNGHAYMGGYRGCNNELGLPCFSGAAGWLTGDVEFWMPWPEAPESTRLQLTKGVAP